MKLQWCALAVLVTGCGKGSTQANSGSGSGSAAPAIAAVATWKLGGLDVPVTFIPKELGAMPTVLPLKPGAPYRLSDFPDDPPNVEHKLIAGYAAGDKPHDDVIVGYDHVAKVDLLADLTKAWGAPARDKRSVDLTSDCWPETNKVKTCWERIGEQAIWHLVYRSSEALAAAAAAPPPPPKPAQTFTDQPLGKGMCKLLGVKEASEIVGVQLAYTEQEKDLCRFGSESHVELAVMDRPHPELNDKNKVDGFADKASWDFVNALVFELDGKGYRISLLNVGATDVETRDATLRIGRVLLPRLAKK